MEKNLECNEQKTMGQIIKELRKRNKMTQAELADCLDIGAASNISKIENDSRMPDSDVLYRLSQLFGVPMETFFPNAKRGSNNRCIMLLFPDSCTNEDIHFILKVILKMDGDIKIINSK